MALTLYGIRNCDTMKRARAWLDAERIPFSFHDYKTEGAPPERLAAWVAALGWEAVLNRSGTTFRQLAEADRANLDANRAIALMLAQPSMIRRPLLEGDWHGQAILLAGFQPATYATQFAAR